LRQKLVLVHIASGNNLIHLLDKSGYLGKLTTITAKQL
jgi:hypothetical protein